MHNTKTDHGERIIPLTEKAMKALKKQRVQKQEIIFKGKAPLEGYKNFETFTPHTFRHSFATRAIENGMQPKVLSRLLGHGQLQITMDLYCHVMDDTLVSEMKKMERQCV